MRRVIIVPNIADKWWAFITTESLDAKKTTGDSIKTVAVSVSWTWNNSNIRKDTKLITLSVKDLVQSKYISFETLKPNWTQYDVYKIFSNKKRIKLAPVISKDWKVQYAPLRAGTYLFVE